MVLVFSDRHSYKELPSSGKNTSIIFRPDWEHVICLLLQFENKTYYKLNPEVKQSTLQTYMLLCVVELLQDSTKIFRYYSYNNLRFYILRT